MLVFHGLSANAGFHPADALRHFLGNVGFGLLGGAVGALVLWALLQRLRLRGVLATEAIIATVVVAAAVSDSIREDTGLIAAIMMGVAVANLAAIESPGDRPFVRTVVQLVIGLLFVDIAATVTAASLGGVLWASLALVVGLIVVVRPVVAALATAGTDLPPGERAFIGLMDPRGIVAASTAAISPRRSPRQASPVLTTCCR